MKNLTPLTSMTSPAVIFQGQGTNWQLALADAAATPMTHARLNSLLDAARSVTGPIARPLASSVPGVVEMSLIHI